MAHSEFGGDEAGQVARGCESRDEQGLVPDGELRPDAGVQAGEVGKLEHPPSGELIRLSRVHTDAVTFNNASRSPQVLVVGELSPPRRRCRRCRRRGC
jgi:hypothetical protein